MITYKTDHVATVFVYPLYTCRPCALQMVMTWAGAPWYIYTRVPFAGPLAAIAFDFTYSTEKDHRFVIVASTAILFWGMHEIASLL